MDAEPLLAALPEAWRGRLTALAGGHTNRSFRLDNTHGRFWLRLGCARAEALGIDRRRELQAHSAAAEAGLAPPIRFACPDSGVLVLDWLDQPDWRRAPGPLAALMPRVAALHRLPAGLAPLDLAAHAGRYLDRLAPVPGWLAEAWPAFSAPALNPPFSPVPCHHDLTAGNLLGGRPWLLDWEYAGLGDPAFDLAVIADDRGLDRAGRARMLACYRAAGGVLDDDRLRARLPWVALLTALWAALQYQYHGTPDYGGLLEQARRRLALSLSSL